MCGSCPSGCVRHVASTLVVQGAIDAQRWSAGRKQNLVLMARSMRMQQKRASGASGQRTDCRLDAPDLITPKTSASIAEAANKKDRLNGGHERSIQQHSGRRPAKAIPIPPKPILEPEASVTAELSEITSTEEAADWAHRVLGAKNGLIAADGERIDEAFRGKLATFATATANGLETPPEKERPRTKRPSHRGKNSTDPR